MKEYLQIAMRQTPPMSVLQRPIARYATSVVAVGTALFLHHFATQDLGLTLPTFILLNPAVMLSALMGGLWPGVLATVLAAFGADYMFMQPTGYLAVERYSDAVALILFTAMGVFMSLVAERYRRSQLAISGFKIMQAQQERDALYGGLFNSMEEGFCIIEMIFSPEGKPVDFLYLDVNTSFEKQTSLRNVVGKRIREIVPSFEDHWLETYGKVALTGKSIHIAGDASSISGYFDVHAYRVGEPEQRRVAVVFSEISERRRNEAHLLQLNRVYSVLSDINQTIVREKDPQLMMEAVCRIAVSKGQFRMAWIGMIDSTTHLLEPIASSGVVDGYLEEVKIDLLDPSTATGPAARCLHTGQHSICNDIEHELFRDWKSHALKNGYRSNASFPLKIDGEIVGVFSFYASECAFFNDDEVKLLDEMAMDISYALEVHRHEQERLKADEELSWRTAFFSAMVESALDGILVTNQEGKILVQNPCVSQLLKLPAGFSTDYNDLEQLEHVKSLMKYPDRFEERVRYLASQLEEVGQDELELLDGTVLDRHTSPVKNKAGEYYGRIWVFQNITAKRQLEAQFRQSQKMEAVGQLTGGIAHDFNNLLTVVLGCSEAIGEEVKDNPRLAMMAEMILNAARRGADLTHRMLAFARRQALQPRSVNINNLLVEMRAFLVRTLSADIELEVIQHEKVCEALVDRAELENALLNVCLNARDAMPNGGMLTIETERTTLDADYALRNPDVTPGEYIRVTVSDTGCGIQPENLGRVFDPFFTTKEVGKGSGLGLSMVYGFAKQSQGHIKIYSEVGRGTSVKLYLPLSSQQTEETEQSEASLGEIRGSEFILLVEDNGPVREFAALQLMNFGYRVLEASNGKDALAVIQAHPEIDLLFTDIVMPGGMNGRELAQQAHVLKPTLKVLFCSGYAENAIFRQGLLGKDEQLLNKPYTRLELSRKIRLVLGGIQ